MSSGWTKKPRVKTASGNTFYRLPPKRRFRGRHLFIILVILWSGFGIYRQIYRPKVNLSRREPAVEADVSSPTAAPPYPAAREANRETSGQFEVRHKIVRSGDTLAGIVNAFGIPYTNENDWGNACKSAPLDGIHEGDELFFVLSREDGLPVRIVYLESDGSSYTLRKTSTGWECGSGETAAGGSGRTIRGVFSGGFYDSCIAGGLPELLVPMLADIFSHDIDFTSDLKQGDSFSVFFQELPIQSNEGKEFFILGAEVRVSGKVYQAFGFQLPDGSWDYFDAKGASLKSAFIRSPVSYAPLLSATTYKSIRPIHKSYRARYGVSYVVPKGSRVCAIGDGVVSAIHKDAKKTLSIEIRHRGGYTSRYGNLSECSHGLTRGAPVSQAEVIGWAGPAGSETARFDFRLYKDRKPINFQTAEFARSKSVPKTSFKEFEKSRDYCAAALHGG